MLRKDAIKNIIDYFEENEDVFNDCIEELDDYNGYLNDNRYYSMDELDDLYCDTKPSEILRLAFYGHDEENGDNSEFCPNREYFTYSGYGNLVSADYKDYSAYLDDYVVGEFEENRRWISTIDDNDELTELFDALEEAYETEEEERLADAEFERKAGYDI